jgi:teichuronic acid biosynthesis glycosyltransferase TuaC
VRILTFTSLFPNTLQRTLGIFIQQRVLHVARRHGEQVCVVAPVTYAPKWLPLANGRKFSQIPSVETSNELEVHHPRYFLVPKISMPLHGLLMFLGSYLCVRQITKKLRIDCIDAHYVYPDGFAAVLLGKALDIPVIVSARGTDINLFPSFVLIRPMIRWTLRHANGLIAVCSALKDAMVKLGADPRKLQVIGNGVDLERFWRVEPSQAREKLGLAADERIIVAVGGLISRKGFHYLIPAFSEVANQDPKLSLYIVGDGESRGELQALAQGLGLGHRVHLVGNRPNEELRYWFSAAEFSCLVSSREGWPNVLLESMACGTPVVATGVWGTPEVIVSPELGIIVEQSVPSIAGGLNRALQKKWDRAAIRQHAESRTWSDVAKEVSDFLAARISDPRHASYLET